MHICPCHSLTSSQPTLHPPRVLKSILYVCIFIPVLPLGSSEPFFFRFRIYMLAYGICFSLSDLLHSVWQTLDPFTSLQITQFRFSKYSIFLASYCSVLNVIYNFFLCKFVYFAHLSALMRLPQRKLLWPCRLVQFPLVSTLRVSVSLTTSIYVITSIV